MLTAWRAWLLNLLYPPKCPACGALVPAHGHWCPSCLQPLWHPRMINGSRLKGGLDGCYCLADYNGAVRRLLQRLKYDRALRYEEACRYLLDRFPWYQRLSSVDRIVPVPLSEQRLRERGYNQSEVIFRAWAEAYGPWEDMLCRVRPTRPQWGLSREERRRNIKRAFRVKDSFCPARGRVLLVDDIYTTGVTMHECAGVLKKNGASQVTGLVIASGAP